MRQTPDIDKLVYQHNGTADFKMRTHRCGQCEQLYSHQCKTGGNHRYICDTCKREHQEVEHA